MRSEDIRESLRSANSRCEEGSEERRRDVGVGRVNSQMSGTFYTEPVEMERKTEGKGPDNKARQIKIPHGQNGGTSDQIKTD